VPLHGLKKRKSSKKKGGGKNWWLKTIVAGGAAKFVLASPGERVRRRLAGRRASNWWINRTMGGSKRTVTGHWLDLEGKKKSQGNWLAGGSSRCDLVAQGALRALKKKKKTAGWKKTKFQGKGGLSSRYGKRGLAKKRETRGTSRSALCYVTGGIGDHQRIFHGSTRGTG